jgi:hypothetical protein
LAAYCHGQCLFENKAANGMIWKQTCFDKRNRLRVETIIEFSIDMDKILSTFQVTTRENQEMEEISYLKIGGSAERHG